MIIDNMIEVDSPIYADTEYQYGNELIVFLRNSRNYLIVYDVSKKTFLKLYNDPTHETMEEILSTHKHTIKHQV